MLKKLLASLTVLLVCAAPALSADATFKQNVVIQNKNLTVTGAGTLTLPSGVVTGGGPLPVNTVTTNTAQTITAQKTFTLGPILTSATLQANGDVLTIQDLGNANLLQSEGAQTINGVKTLNETVVLKGTGSNELAWLLDPPGTGLVRLVLTAQSSANRYLILPDLGVLDSTVATREQAETFTGAKSFAENVSISVAGKGLHVKTGANARSGVSTLVAGQVVVSNTSVTANTHIHLSPQGIANAGFLGVTKNPGVGFTIDSSSGTDVRDVEWDMIEATP